MHNFKSLQPQKLYLRKGLQKNNGWHSRIFIIQIEPLDTLT